MNECAQLFCYTVIKDGRRYASARVDLSVGDTCDEINETGYCAHGLICHNCVGDIPYKCVKCECVFFQ